MRVRCGIRIWAKRISFLGPVSVRLGQVLYKRTALLPHLAAPGRHRGRVCHINRHSSSCIGKEIAMLRPTKAVCEPIHPRSPPGCWRTDCPRHPLCHALYSVANPGPRRADRGYAGDGFALIGAVCTATGNVKTLWPCSVQRIDCGS